MKAIENYCSFVVKFQEYAHVRLLYTFCYREKRREGTKMMYLNVKCSYDSGIIWALKKILCVVLNEDKSQVEMKRQVEDDMWKERERGKGCFFSCMWNAIFQLYSVGKKKFHICICTQSTPKSSESIDELRFSLILFFCIAGFFSTAFFVSREEGTFPGKKLILLVL